MTEASNNAFVLVHLSSSSSGNVESQRLTELWRQLATKFGDIKFCEIRGNMCIEGYPERNTPTILVYKDGEIRRQLVTLRELKGPRTTIEGKFNPLFIIGEQSSIWCQSLGINFYLDRSRKDAPRLRRPQGE